MRKSEYYVISFTVMFSFIRKLLPIVDQVTGLFKGLELHGNNDKLCRSGASGKTQVTGIRGLKIGSHLVVRGPSL